MDTRADGTDPLDDDLELLLSVLPVFIEAADSFATKQTTIDGRSPYLYMQGLCMLVLGELSRTKPLVNSDTQCVAQLLDHLERLLRQPTYLETLSKRPDTSSHQPHIKLTALKSKCTPLKQPSSFQDEPSPPISSWLDLDDGQRIIDVQRQLQVVYDFCRLNFPENSPIYVDEYTPPKRERAEPAWAVWKAAQSTYRLLTSVKDCACEPSHPYDTRLFLATHRDQKVQENNYNFEVFLSLGSPWQEVRIGILDEPCVRVLIDDKPVTKPVKKNKQIKNLCKLMKQFSNQQLRFFRLRFTVENGSLWNSIPERSPFPLDISGRQISLEEFIGTRGLTLTEMTKRIIAVMLGHGFLHLHGTGWLQQSWGASNVIFHQVSSAIPIRPYIQVNMVDNDPKHCRDESDVSDDEEDYFGNDDCFAHPLPGLVALGMMLMQVYMARTFDSIAREFDIEDPEQLNSNAKFALASDAFKKYASAISFSEQYWHAIDKCLDPNIQYDEDGEVMSQDDLRRAIYDEIVGPLEDELVQGKFSTSASSFILNLDTEARHLDLANWGQPLKFQTASKTDRSAVSLFKRLKSTMLSQQKQDQKDEVAQPIPGKVVGRFRRAGSRRRTLCCVSKQMWLCKPPASDFFDDESRQEDISQQARDDFLSWKEDVLEVYDEFLASALGSQPTRIAVLDTGLDFKHPDFTYNSERQQRVRAQKDFTGETLKGKDNRDVFDESGHGTHIAGLLLDLAPGSELYIAKIASQDPSPNPFIAEAIRHAVDEWGVDIISMSFGFTTRDSHYNLVEDALEYANSKNVLLFAAASNSGANQRRTFPARHDYVICVHSSAADGVPSRFNAPREGSNNFATIGEAIESSWPTHLCDKKMNDSCIAWKSGTSFATPIAVGIATFLLQYAKENLDTRAIKLLRKPQGMRAVFREIASEKDGYDYIAPKIHPDHLFGRNKDYVRQRITVVLENS